MDNAVQSRVVSPLRQRFPLAGILLAAIFGILLASHCGVTSSLFCLLGALWVIGAVFRRNGGLVWALTLTVFALLQLWQWNEAPDRLVARSLNLAGRECSVTGIVVSEPRTSVAGTSSFTLRTERIAPLHGAGYGEGSVGGSPFPIGPVTLPVHVLVRWEGAIPSYGDRVAFHAIAESPAPPRNPGSMDYGEWLRRHGIHTEFRIDPAAPGCILSGGHGNPLIAAAIAARHRMEGILEIDLGGAPEVNGAIKGICLGVTDQAPEGFTDDFRFTGTMHLFAVSGLHVGMLAVILWFALRSFRIPRSWSIALTIPILFWYVLVTGMKSGSIRSATMTSILLLGLVFLRRSPMLNVLAASALLQLMWDTNTLFSAGWQFSYSVVSAILLFTPIIEARLSGMHARDPFLPARLLTPWERLRFRCWKHGAGLAAVSFGAWIGSIIPTIAYFHLVSFSAFGANLIAVPLAFGVLSLGALSLLAGTFSPWIAGGFNNCNWLLAKGLVFTVQASAMIPGGHWFVGPPGKPYPALTLLDLRGGSCSVIRSAGHFSLIGAGRRGDARRVIVPCLEALGANRIGSVLVTKADASSLGGLPALGAEWRIGRIGVPAGTTRSRTAREVLSGEDVFRGSQFPMDATAIPVEKLHAGMLWPLAPGVTAEILAPPEGGDSDALIARIRLGTLRVLFLPNLTPAFAGKFLPAVPPDLLRAEVLVVPLGGTDFSMGMQWIRAVAPRVVITTVNTLARHGVPSREWNHLLAEEGIALMRQDETGSVSIEAEPRNPVAVPFLEKAGSVGQIGLSPSMASGNMGVPNQ